MTAFDVVDIIRHKRDGHRLADEAIDWFIYAYTNGEVADEQAAALLMAIVWRGLSSSELARWTDAMIRSGERLDLSAVKRPTVDKHSTGGVGDKISLILCPLVAACGAAVPQLSGRGLGHTGGTLDKLESISGWQAHLSNPDLVEILNRVGAVIAGASATLAPADRKLYALRDVTGTVESIPLIASSIMSKKIAEGTESLVLDVKTGFGAFMAEEADAIELARTMVELGKAHGVRTRALVTNMDVPLGLTAGNALEVQESIEVLQGGGPPDVVELTVALAEAMVALAGLNVNPRDVLASGKAYEVWEAMIAAQGGNPHAALPVAPHVETITAQTSGVLQHLNARDVGVAAWRLGAGRARKEDPVSAVAGVVLKAKVGDEVKIGDVLFELHTDKPARFVSAKAALDAAVHIGKEQVAMRPLVIAEIS
ncbi:MAG: thymidine phosphorylase [Acidimicrobiia bacterium]